MYKPWNWRIRAASSDVIVLKDIHDPLWNRAYVNLTHSDSYSYLCLLLKRRFHSSSWASSELWNTTDIAVPNFFQFLVICDTTNGIPQCQRCFHSSDNAPWFFLASFRPNRNTRNDTRLELLDNEANSFIDWTINISVANCTRIICAQYYTTYSGLKCCVKQRYSTFDSRSRNDTGNQLERNCSCHRPYRHYLPSFQYWKVVKILNIGPTWWVESTL